MNDLPDDLVFIGKIAGVHGVQGWVRIYSHTRPTQNILTYTPWYLHTTGEHQAVNLADSRVSSKRLLARIGGYDDRTRAMLLVGSLIYVSRSQFEATEPDEYYWSDLQGLEVVTTSGAVLGTVTSLMETGANDVLVVNNGESECLIPFVREKIIIKVDLQLKTITVDWDYS